jgi:putative transcriptional regulator
MLILKSRLKDYRQKAHLDVADVAVRVGVCEDIITCLENGQLNPSLKLTMDLAALFKLPVTQLFWFEEESFLD